MPSNYTVNGVDLDTIFKARSSTKRADIDIKVGGVDISNRYEPTNGSDQITTNTDIKINNTTDLRYVFQSYNYVLPTTTTTTTTTVAPTTTTTTTTVAPTNYTNIEMTVGFEPDIYGHSVSRGFLAAASTDTNATYKLVTNQGDFVFSKGPATILAEAPNPTTYWSNGDFGFYSFRKYIQYTGQPSATIATYEIHLYTISIINADGTVNKVYDINKNVVFEKIDTLNNPSPGAGDQGQIDMLSMVDGLNTNAVYTELFRVPSGPKRAVPLEDPDSYQPFNFRIAFKLQLYTATTPAPTTTTTTTPAPTTTTTTTPAPTTTTTTTPAPTTTTTTTPAPVATTTTPAPTTTTTTTPAPTTTTTTTPAPTTPTIIPAVWSQLGADIEGVDLTYSWSNVSMNAAGDRIVFSVMNGNYDDVRVYSFNGSTWSQLGADIIGSATYLNYVVPSVSMNEDGDRIVIGDPKQGLIRVYSWNGSDWSQLGANIISEAYIINVSMNADGDRIAIGDSTAHQGGTSSDRVRVYSWNGSDWSQLGADIIEETFTGSETIVRMNAAGNRVAVGTGGVGSGGDDGDNGRVRVYSWNGSVWSQLGADIDAPISGRSLGMNEDGDRIVIDLSYADVVPNVYEDKVRVYSWNGSDWSQLGADIIVTKEDDWGICVSMNGSGDRIVVGANSQPALYMNYTGLVRAYSWNGSVWSQLGPAVVGEVDDGIGWSVIMNAAGDRVAFGTNHGLVRGYSITV